MSLDRRRFVASLGGLVAAGAAGAGGYLWPRRFLIQYAIRRDDALADLEPLPSSPGVLDAPARDALWRLFSAISQRWQMVAVTRPELEYVVDLKCQEAPSFLIEYRNALDLFEGERRHSDDVGALMTLLEAPSTRGDEPTTAGRAQAFVLGELIMLQVIRGGFLQFDAINTRGFMGGSFGYRRLERI